MFPFMFTKEVEDEFSQENFLRIQDYFKVFPFTAGNFQFYEITETSAVTDKAFPHRLSFQPKDIIVTHNLNNVALTWNYAQFDTTNIVYSLSGPTTFRFLLGRFN